MGRRACGVARSRAPPPGGAPRRSRSPGRSRRDLLLFITRPRPAAPVNTSLRRVIHRRLTAGAAARAARLGGPAGAGSGAGPAGAGPRGGARELRAPLPVPPLPPLIPWAPQSWGTSPSAHFPSTWVSHQARLCRIWAPRWGAPGQAGRSLHSHRARAAVRADPRWQLGWSRPAPALPSPPRFLVCAARRSEPPPVRGSHRWRLGQVLAPGRRQARGCCCVHSLGSRAPSGGVLNYHSQSQEETSSRLRGCGVGFATRHRGLGQSHARSGPGKKQVGEARSGRSMRRPQLARLREWET